MRLLRLAWLQPMVVSLLLIQISAAPLAAQVYDLDRLDLPRWTVAPELRLGSLDGPHDAFVSPSSVALGPDGLVYVLDPGIPALRVFRESGDFVRTIGSKGEGPGEYMNPVGFGFIGDSIWVSDMRTRRITFYDRHGQTLETVTVPSDGWGVGGSVLPIAVKAGGTRIRAVAPASPSLRGRDAGPVAFRQALIEIDRKSRDVDTLMVRTTEIPLIVIRAGGTGLFGYQPIRDGAAVSYVQSRDAVRTVHRGAADSGDAAEFRIVVKARGGGAALLDPRYRYTPLRLERATRDSLWSEAVSRMEIMGAERRREWEPLIREHLYLPEFQPPVTEVREGGDGTLWLRREPFHPRGNEWLVLDDQLRPVATAHLPASIDGVRGAISANTLWATERDELDVPYLVRYRIRRGGE